MSHPRKIHADPIIIEIQPSLRNTDDQKVGDLDPLRGDNHQDASIMLYNPDYSPVDNEHKTEKSVNIHHVAADGCDDRRRLTDEYYLKWWRKTKCKAEKKAEQMRDKDYFKIYINKAFCAIPPRYITLLYAVLSESKYHFYELVDSLDKDNIFYFYSNLVPQQQFHFARSLNKDDQITKIWPLLCEKHLTSLKDKVWTFWGSSALQIYILKKLFSKKTIKAKLNDPHQLLNLIQLLINLSTNQEVKYIWGLLEDVAQNRVKEYFFLGNQEKGINIDTRSFIRLSPEARHYLFTRLDRFKFYDADKKKYFVHFRDTYSERKKVLSNVNLISSLSQEGLAELWKTLKYESVIPKVYHAPKLLLDNLFQRVAEPQYAVLLGQKSSLANPIRQEYELNRVIITLLRLEKLLSNDAVSDKQLKMYKDIFKNFHQYRRVQQIYSNLRQEENTREMKKERNEYDTHVINQENLGAHTVQPGEVLRRIPVNILYAEIRTQQNLAVKQRAEDDNNSHLVP